MKQVVKEMISEVDAMELGCNASEEIYQKLETKIKKKFKEEIDKLEKSFKRIIEQMQHQQQSLYQIMKDQIDKELKCLIEKKKKLKEREDQMFFNK